jgi:hypothetical protein
MEVGRKVGRAWAEQAGYGSRRQSRQAMEVGGIVGKAWKEEAKAGYGCKGIVRKAWKKEAT